MKQLSLATHLARRRRPLIGLITAAGMAAGVLAGAGPAAAAPLPVGSLPVGSALTAAYAAYRHIPRGDIASIRAGSLHLTHGPSARPQRATASFLPRLKDPARVLDGFQDGAGSAVFTRRDGGPWRVVREVGNRPPPAPRVRPSVANPTSIAGIAEQNVGIGDTPASTSFSFDCNPYTTMVGVGVSSGGCGTDPHFGVLDEDEEWCADFTKWVWEQGGVTADLGTLDPAAASFYTWGQEQSESMPTDPSNPVPGDAVVFYPAGSPPNGSYADHVGIVASVNSDGTVNLVNGDFLGSSNITVQANNDVSLGPWSADVWGSGEQWIFVSPGRAVSSNLLTNGSFESSASGWDRFIPSGVTVNVSHYQVGHGAPAGAHDGSWYLATNTNGAGGAIYQDVTVNAPAGSSYVATAWLSAQSGTATGQLCVWGLASPGTDNCEPYSVTAGKYSQVQLVYDLPSSYSTLRFQLYPTPNGGTTDMDSASLVQNLLTNGSFESSASGWDRFIPSGVTVNVSHYQVGHGAPVGSHDGSWYLATNTNGAGGAVYQDVTVNAPAGSSYVATAWLSAQSGTATGQLCLWGLGSPGTDTCEPYSVTAGAYSQVQLVYDLPSSYSTLRFQLYPTPNGGTTDLDSASVVQNLLANGSLESSASGWDRFIPSGVTVNVSHYQVGHGAPAGAHDGSWYLATNTNGAGGAIYQDIAVNASAGSSYVATAWLSAQSGTATGQLCLWGLASPGTDTCEPYSVTAGTYTEIQLVYDLPASYSTLRFQLYPTPNGGTTDFDSASIS